MSNSMIHIVPENFKQAPDHYNSASLNLSKALQSLSSYKTQLYYSGFESRCTAYTSSYNTIKSNVESTNRYTTYLKNTSESILAQYESFESSDTGADVTVQDTSGLVDTTDYAQTNATTGETSDDNTVWENIWGWICDAASAVKEFIEGLVATFLDLVASLLQGLFKLVESIIDVAVLLVGTVVGLVCSAINFLFGTNIDVHAIREWIQGFVATDWVGSAFQWFYNNTGFGQWMAENSIIYGTFVQDIIVGAGTWVGIIGLGAVVTFFTGGTALAPYVALVAGVYGFGSGTETAYANGASFMGGMGLGLLKGAFNAIAGYGVGTAVQALTGTLTTLVAKDGTIFALRRIGSGLATQWKWVAMQGSQMAGTALVPFVSSTALVPYVGAIGPYIGAAILPQILGYGAFGIGSVIMGGGLLGLFDALQPSGGVIADWAQGGTTGGKTPVTPPGPGGTEGQRCEKCNNPIEECTCEPTEEDETEICDKCKKPVTECVCQKEDDEKEEEKCSICGLPLSECKGHTEEPGTDGPGTEGEKCSICGLPLSECKGHTEEPGTAGPGTEEEKCSICGLPLSQCQGHSQGPGTEEEKCSICGLPLSQCQGHTEEPSTEVPGTEEEKCPTCGLPLSQCQGHNEEPSTEVPGTEEEKCPTCGLPLSECPGHNEEPGTEEPGTEEPGTEDPGVESPVEGKDPNITFVNVGPQNVEVTPSSGNISYETSGGNISGGYVDTNPGAGIIDGGTPEYDIPSSGTINVGSDSKPLYEFESMTPTLENPDLENISLDPINNTTFNNITTPVGNSMENINVTSYSELSQPSNTGFDNSTLGMGGIAFGAAAASMYGASRRNETSSEKKKEENKKTEEEPNRFDEI